jgi:hypothetical protein
MRLSRCVQFGVVSAASRALGAALFAAAGT